MTFNIVFKNLSIRQISVLTSLVIWAVHVLLVLMTFKLFGSGENPFKYFIVYVIVSFFLGYILLKWLFETFVFRKIKLIYKVISDSKVSLKDVSDFGSLETTLDDVNNKVVAWAEKTEKEISSLKSLEEYRKKYVGDISHELRTPIFSIQGYLHTLLEGGIYDENVNIKYLERAVSNLSRLQTIVEDLDLISKLETEDGVLEFTQFDIKELIQNIINDLEIQAKKKGIALFFKPGADAAFNVLADKDKIEQVFINIIKNSIKYGNTDGFTKVSFYDMDERILVEVSDDGIGIKEEDLKHVFDRFYRSDKSRSRKEAGSGLGLSIVKHIIEAHMQKVTLRSTLGEGSTFGVTLQKI